MSEKKVTTTVNKSAVTGKFVSSAQVANNPKQTYKQTVTKTVGKSK